jgi:polysaccharide export outer membrane protein
MMSRLQRSGTWSRLSFTALTALILLFTVVAQAQTVQLSAEQQRMLDQLPAAQKQQAMDAIRRMEAQQASPSQQSINEAIGVTPPLEAESEDLETDVEEEATAQAHTRLVLRFNLYADLEPLEALELEEDPALSQLLGSHLFILDDSGTLTLEGFADIPLLGLNEEEIVLRLEAEPYLAKVVVAANILSQEPMGVAALKPFGYDLFEPRETDFDPPSSGPVPPDYILGPGDSIRVQLYGNVSGIYEFEVTRDGILNLPELGPVTVVGMRFSEFRADLNERVQEMLIGTHISVTMGQLRSMRVFVLGEAGRPGSYVVSGLATVSSTLYRSGGVSPVGSLRNIQLKRKGQIVERLDLYDLLLNGDTSSDSRLQPGDVIFIPPVGPQVSVDGAVRRPAIYETKGESTVSDLVDLAGGLLPDAYPNGARIERIEASRGRVTISIDADSQSARETPVRSGDVLFIPEVLPHIEDTVTLLGHVHRPGPFQWRRGMRLTDVIGSALELQPGADSDYIMIRREDPTDRRVYVQSANLTKALQDPASDENIRLQPRDTLYVFDLTYARERIISPILEELQLQARFGEPYQEVSVIGPVRSPGTFPLESGMRVSDLVRAGGSLAEQAYGFKAELVRYGTRDNEYRDAEVISIDLDGIRRGDLTADLLLESHDNLRISAVPQWDDMTSVVLDGEVIFPGTYRIRRGETLQEVLERAGGLTDRAFASGAIFLRESLRIREQEQMDVLAGRLEADLATLSLQTVETAGAETMETGEALLRQLRSTPAVGRLVVDLDTTAGGIELREGDRLLIPIRSQEITVIGETQQNASHLYRTDLSREDYIAMSGGLTRRGDKKLIYVVRASGEVVAGGRSRWLGRNSGTEIRPGDTIVVPLETDRIRPMTFWTNVTQIIYQGAIAVAAIQSFN